jgi:hypothetical protein
LSALPFSPSGVEGPSSLRSARRSLSLCLALAAALCAAPSFAAAKKKAPHAAGIETQLKPVRGAAQVVYVSPTRAYLDRGASDGLAAGETLMLTRQGHAAGTCELEWVAEHSASCAGQGLRVADRVALPAQARPRVKLPAPLVDPDELARRRAVLEGKEVPKVVFKGASRARAAGGALASVAVGHTSWGSTGSAQGPFQQERVDAALNGAEVGLGVRAWADLSVVAWARRPEGFRAFTTAPAQLYVRRAELSLRGSDRWYALAVGRTAPRFAPGLLVLDGAQAGLRNDNTEGGVYAGEVPDTVTLDASLAHFTAGGYVTHRFAFDDALLQPEARVAYVEGMNGPRLEAEVAAHAWAGKTVDAHVQALFATGPGGGVAMAPALLERMRLDVSARPSEVFTFQAGVRYDWTDAREAIPQGALTFGTHSLFADAGATYELSKTLVLGLRGGVSSDFASALWRACIGPELTFPGLLGERGALSVGYQEEVGWLSGRSAWVQAAMFPHERVRLLARGSFFMQGPQADVEGFAAEELGVYAGLDVRVLRWLWVRGSLLGRVGLDAGPPAGFTGSLQVGGDL